MISEDLRILEISGIFLKNLRDFSPEISQENSWDFQKIHEITPLRILLAGEIFNVCSRSRLRSEMLASEASALSDAYDSERSEGHIIA